MDVIYQGQTWRRQVIIVNDADPPEPVDPTELAAVLLIPARATDDDTATTVALTITGPDDPGIYEVSLSAEDTAELPAQMQTRWELAGLVGSDVLAIVQADVVVQPFAARLEV